MKITQNDIWKIKSGYTKTTAPCDPRGGETGKSDTRRARKVKHKYNTRSKVNHVKIFKNTPQILKKDMTDTSTTQIGSDYISNINPKKDTITVEPVAHHIACETTRKILQ